jgi:hypothetical protein
LKDQRFEPPVSVDLDGAHFPRVRARGTPTRSGRLGGAASGGRRRHFVLAECGIRFGANDNDARFGAKMVRSGVRGERDPLAPLLAAVMLLRPPAAPFSYRVIENRRH